MAESRDVNVAQYFCSAGGDSYQIREFLILNFLKIGDESFRWVGDEFEGCDGVEDVVFVNIVDAGNIVCGCRSDDRRCTRRFRG